MAEKIIEARAVISAEDRTGNKFAKIGEKMDRLANTAKRFDAVSRRAFGNSSAVDRYAGALGRAERQARQLDRVNHRTARSIDAVGHAARRTHRLLGHLTGGYLAYEAARHGGKVAVDFQRERVRASAAGMSPKEIAHGEDTAIALGQKYPQISAGDAMHLLRNFRSIVGTYEEAAHILEPVLKLRVIAEGAHPGKDMNEDFDKLIKGMEIKGVTQDMPKFLHYMEGMARAINVFGDTLRPTDFYEAFKYGRAATNALSDHFMLSTAPTLAQELGGSSTGKALSSFYTQFVGGKMSNRAVGTLQEYGLLDPKKVIKTKTGNVKGVKPGGIVGSEYLQPGQTDPYAWVNKVLLPHLAAKGVTDPAKIQEIIASISSQTTTAQMLAIFATQQARIEKDWHLVEGAKGLDAAGDFQKRDPGTAFRGLIGAMDSLIQVTANPLMEPAAAAMKSLAESIASLTAAAKDHPDLALAAGGAAAAAGVAGALGLGRGVIALLTAGGSLNGSATALTGAAASLEAAAAALKAPSLPNGPQTTPLEKVAKGGATGTAGGAAARALGVRGGMLLGGEILGALGAISLLLQEAFPTTGQGENYRQKNGGVPFDVYERSRRQDLERRLDPEGARGRAFQRLPDPFADQIGGGAVSRQLGGVLTDIAAKLAPGQIVSRMAPDSRADVRVRVEVDGGKVTNMSATSTGNIRANVGTGGGSSSGNAGTSTGSSDGYSGMGR